MDEKEQFHREIAYTEEQRSQAEAYTNMLHVLKSYHERVYMGSYGARCEISVPGGEKAELAKHCVADGAAQLYIGALAEAIRCIKIVYQIDDED